MKPDEVDTGPLIDKAAGRLVRPYLATGGRTAPSVKLDLLTLVWSTGQRRPSEVEPEQAEVLLLCGEPISIAEIAAHTRMIAMSVKVLVGDLIEYNAVQVLSPEPHDGGYDLETLQRIHDGLLKLL